MRDLTEQSRETETGVIERDIQRYKEITVHFRIEGFLWHFSHCVPKLESLRDILLVFIRTAGIFLMFFSLFICRTLLYNITHAGRASDVRADCMRGFIQEAYSRVAFILIGVFCLKV